MYKRFLAGSLTSFRISQRLGASIKDILTYVDFDQENLPWSDSRLETNLQLLQHQASSGKVGLALSGGGLRAALFHLGVLARLADVDLLRQVEVLSLVSGGSIVGSCYYLKLQERLRSKHNIELCKEEYQTMIRELIVDFVKASQSNIRTRIMSNPIANLFMWLSPTYSRTYRLGSLIDTLLFRKICKVPGVNRPWFVNFERLMQLAPCSPESMEYIYKKKYGNRPRWPPWLMDLETVPFGEEKPPFEDNDPLEKALGNRLRVHKVPALILNATTLNSGHNWQFTQSTLGEPPYAIDQEIDASKRLRRIDFLALNEWQKSGRIRLSRAVAASACVPGLFPPLVFRRPYKGVHVHLVDGGVFDNQGVSSLLDAGCDVVLISDASGQMDFEKQPVGHAIGTLKRSNSILQQRVRQGQYRELLARNEKGQIQALMFVHLKSELSVGRLGQGNDNDIDAAHERTIEEWRKKKQRCTSYGIDHRAQRCLANMRTDLDCFTEIESYSLMTSGYQIASAQLNGQQFTSFGLDTPTDEEKDSWPFFKLYDALASYDELNRVGLILSVGDKRVFRTLWIPIRWVKVAVSRVVAHIVSTVVNRKTNHLKKQPKWLQQAKRVAGKTIITGFLLIALFTLWTKVLSKISQTLMIHIPAIHIEGVGIMLLFAIVFVICLVIVLPKRYARYLLGLIAGIALPFLMLASWIQLYLIDPIYRQIGRSCHIKQSTTLRKSNEYKPKDTSRTLS